MSGDDARYTTSGDGNPPAGLFVSRVSGLA